MKMPPAIGAMRQELALLRSRLNIALNRRERARRRRAVADCVPSNIADGRWDDTKRALAGDGFAPWTLAPESKERLIDSWRSVLRQRSNGSADDVDRSTGKRFFEESLSLRNLQSYPDFVGVAIDESLLSVVAQSFGMVPHLESVEVVVSHATTGPHVASQLWHRDVNDTRILKLFVYLNDVGSEEGPFTYIPAQFSAQVPRRSKHYLSDEFVERFAPTTSWRRVEGGSGTAFLIDTGRCYHCGSRCTNPRTAYIATYSCGIKCMKYAARWPEILGERAASLSRLQLAACGMR